jgi:hypothetical protein
MSRIRTVVAGAAIALAAAQIFTASSARAERTIQVTNGTEAGFWVMALDQDLAGRSITYGPTSYRVMPGETTQLACGSGQGCDLLLGIAPAAGAPSFHNIMDSCIRITTYSASRGNAAYSAC